MGKKWEDEPNIYLDRLKFDDDVFRYYKEEIEKNKERYKPVLLELLEEKKIKCCIREIIKIWEKKWKEEPSIEIDKLKFSYYTFQEYREEIKNDKEKYKPILLELLENNRIYQFIIYKEIIEIWEEEWKEESNEYINKLKIEIDRLKFEDKDIFKEYKEEISKDKEKYKPILLELLKQYKINKDIHEEIIEIWEEEWKEEENIEIDKLKFEDNDIFEEYKEEIIKDKERYKPALLKAVEENIKGMLGDLYLCPSVLKLWECEWKEEPNLEVDKLIFGGWYFDEDYEDYLNFDENDELDYENEDDYYQYEQALITKELIENPKRYKPVLLKLLETNIEDIRKDLFLCPSVVTLWEEEWKEEANIYIDKLKFYNEDAFLDFEDKIIANPERYKPILIDLILNEDYFFYDLYKHILDE